VAHKLTYSLILPTFLNQGKTKRYSNRSTYDKLSPTSVCPLFAEAIVQLDDLKETKAPQMDDAV